MNEAYTELLPQSEVYGLEQLELFDERELMRQLFDHYCLTMAWKNSKDVTFDDNTDSGPCKAS